ncbi:MAG: hypothetical protein ETSY1_36475 [Candidatus Entotheonella factor]|uniref:Uncharacterized protein n=1 Tax=Entotheonella factor TaxID=1429438 RepID=W4L9P8_ENTF1|nr:MAG: hypothetical protein ETSY1_36475 [Candidatus Entotheonella factor]
MTEAIELARMLQQDINSFRPKQPDPTAQPCSSTIQEEHHYA